MHGPSLVLVIIRHVRGPSPTDPIDRAHLTGVSRPSPPIYRYQPSEDLRPLVQRYWVPVWSLTEPQRQSTLQHPACLVVISNTYARFYGVVRGLSTVTLEGTGWAVGTMLSPAAGALLLGGPVTPMSERHIDLAEVPTLDAVTLVDRVRAALAADPTAPGAHLDAVAEVERQSASCAACFPSTRRACWSTSSSTGWGSVPTVAGSPTWPRRSDSPNERCSGWWCSGSA